ncbi:MAG TPA: cytochrome c biogenesis protein CcdA [Gammaproteobacteria bacterium]|nr:cytochrome c biogenesis protein CcdA [Gammaproteobacteria bacterium]
MTVTIAFAFFIGTITTVNPCGFVLLPAYFTHRLGTRSGGDGNKLDAVLHAITIGISATSGFVLVFAIVGGATVFGAHWLSSVFPWTGLVIGVVLMIVGLWIMLGLRITLRIPALAHLSPKNDLGGDFAYGAGYAIVSLSCTLPIFLAITGTTFSEGILPNITNFIAFALGVGTILTALSVSAALARSGLERTLKSFLPYVHRASGAILFLAGLYVSYLLGSALFAADSPVSNMLATGERLSAILKIWFVGPLGKFVTVVILVILITLSIGSYLYHQMRKK